MIRYWVRKVKYNTAQLFHESVVILYDDMYGGDQALMAKVINFYHVAWQWWKYIQYMIYLSKNLNRRM